MNNIILTKRKIEEKLVGFDTSSSKIAFLRWQIENLCKSDFNGSEYHKDQVTFKNKLAWLNYRINIISNTVDEKEHSTFF